MSDAAENRAQGKRACRQRYLQPSRKLCKTHRVSSQDDRDVPVRTAEQARHRGHGGVCTDPAQAPGTNARGAHACPCVRAARLARGSGAPLSYYMQSPDLFRLEQFVGGCNFNYLRAEEPIRGCAHRGFYEFP